MFVHLTYVHAPESTENMCRCSLVISETFIRLQPDIWGFFYEILPWSYRGRCYSAGTGTQAWKMRDGGKGQLRWVAGWQPQPKASPQPPQGNLISCFRDSCGPASLPVSFSGNGGELIPHFQMMCLISLSSIRNVEVWKQLINTGAFFPAAWRGLVCCLRLVFNFLLVL